LGAGGELGPSVEHEIEELPLLDVITGERAAEYRLEVLRGDGRELREEPAAEGLRAQEWGEGRREALRMKGRAFLGFRFEFLVVRLGSGSFAIHVPTKQTGNLGAKGCDHESNEAGTSELTASMGLGGKGKERREEHDHRIQKEHIFIMMTSKKCRKSFRF